MLSSFFIHIDSCFHHKLLLVVACLFMSVTLFAQGGKHDGFSISKIPDVVFARMQGKSYPKSCPVPRGELRYLRLLHVDFNGRVCHGELVCNKAIANDVLEIFKQLYEHRYPIESVRLIDDFGADDERSMRSNNSSSFCYRAVKGSRKLSAHARGMAVDINTLYNPCVRRLRSGRVVVQPSVATKYIDRSRMFPGTIVRGDLLWKLFTSRGFKWGGSWKSVKDYQHFEK